ncbi:hypothetical protein HZP32_05560 [Elizabethkingia anophelis]|nr:hypothetical protein [Elizabethkingia anophelis]
MKKLIFILITMLFIMACSSGDNRDNTEPPKEYKLEPEFYKKFSAQYMTVYTVNSTGTPVKLNTSTDNDIYVVISSDNIATLKIFNDTYSGPIKIYNNRTYGFKDYKLGININVQSSMKGYSIGGIQQIKDGIQSYTPCDCSSPIEIARN